MKQTEIKNVATGLTIDYEGIFDLAGLITFIDSFFRKKEYEKKVVKHTQKNKKNKKEVLLVLRPVKDLGKVKGEIRLTLKITEMTDVSISVDGINVSINKGKVNVVIDSYILTNERGNFELRPTYILVTHIFNKFLIEPKQKNHSGMIAGDSSELKNEIESFLLLNKYLT